MIYKFIALTQIHTYRNCSFPHHPIFQFFELFFFICRVVVAVAHNCLVAKISPMAIDTLSSIFFCLLLVFFFMCFRQKNACNNCVEGHWPKHFALKKPTKHFAVTTIIYAVYLYTYI